MAANSAAMATTMVSKRHTRIEAARGLKTLVHAGAKDKEEFTLDIPNKNNLTWVAVQRGMLEIADYAALVHRTQFSNLNFHDLMGTLFESYRADFADICEILDDGERLTTDISAKLDANVFYVLGARMMAGDKAALQAFFRRERPRYESAAKKIGWKPATPRKADPPSTTTKTPSPTKPSPAGSRNPKRGRDAGDDADGDSKEARGSRDHTSVRGRGKGRGRRQKKEAAAAGAGAAATTTTFT